MSAQSAAYETDDAAVVDGRRGAEIATLLLTFAGTIATVASRARARPSPIAGLLAAFVGLTLVVGLVVRMRRAERVRLGARGALRVDADGVDWNGKLVAPRTKFDAGVILPNTEHGTVVRLLHARTHITRFEVRVRDFDAGRRVLEALGLDAARRAFETRAISPATTSRSAIATLALGAGAATWIFTTMGDVGPAWLGPVILAAAVGSLAWPQTLRIGSDGVFTRWLGRRRFVPYAQIERVERLAHGIRIHRYRSRPIDIALVSPNRARSASVRAAQQVAIVYERIREAMTLRADRTHIDPNALARGERPVSVWLDAIRTLVAHADGGMRSTPVLRDDLWRILRDPQADPSARAGAAAALGYALDADERTKLRVVADAIASPRLRVTVEAAAGRDEAKLCEALEAVAAENRLRAG